MASRVSTMLISVLALALCLLGTAHAASDCSTIRGCTSCTYVLKSGIAALNCTACATPAYSLTAAGACACNAGHFSRFANGTRTGRCDPVPDGWVAAAGAINNTANILRACQNNSIPDAARAKCLCLPGFYAAVNGQVPQCNACNSAGYTNETNTRTACKLCPVGQVANANNTGCVAVSAALKNATAAANKTMSGASALITGVRQNMTSAVNKTLSEARALVAEARQNVTAAVANYSSLVNATLYDLRHPIATLRTVNVSNPFGSAAINISKPLGSLSLGKVPSVATNGLVRLANATGAAELASAWSALQDRGLPALIPNISDGINVNVTSAMGALAKVAGTIAQNDAARTLLIQVISKLVEAALSSSTTATASG